MSNTTFSRGNYLANTRRGAMWGWPLLAVSLTALLGACAAQGSGTSGSSTMGSAASPDTPFREAAAQGTDTDGRVFIPMEDITRNGDGRALMWSTGTPVPEFGDSSY